VLGTQRYDGIVGQFAVHFVTDGNNVYISTRTRPPEGPRHRSASWGGSAVTDRHIGVRMVKTTSR
jgi:hypothetical protein